MKAVLACAALAIVHCAPGASGNAGDVLRRITVIDPAVRELLVEGYERSQTFRTLVDTVEKSHWRVFIQRGRCPAETLKSCLLHYTGTFEGEPYLQVMITMAGRSRHRLIVALAHELQHAVEVVRSPEVVDTKTLQELFTRIGFVTGIVRVNNRRIAVYETRAADAVEDMVRREIDNPSLDER